MANTSNIKKYNQVITVEIPVNAIAEKLRKTFAESFEHADILTDTIIGLALNNQDLTYIYNNLNGYTNEIDFQVGQPIICTDQSYCYVQQEDGSYKEKYVEMGQATIIEINLYRSDKLCISFASVNSKGESITKTSWVKHTKCAGFDLEDNNIYEADNHINLRKAKKASAYNN